MNRQLLIIFALIFTCSLSGQDQKMKNFPVQVSFVHPLGTMGSACPDYRYNFSVNMLMGYVGAINGFEVGGLINVARNSVNGFQAAGIGNKAGGMVNGFQVAGISNISEGMKGFQAAGVLNMNSGDVKGFQAGGILNISKNFEGFRVAGIANMANGDVKGTQVSGMLNYTKKLDGFQLGVINITDTAVRGISMGVINIYRHGSYSEFEIGMADFANLSFTYKYGLAKFYTIYTVGTNFIEDNLWITGIGFGCTTDKNSKFYLQPEAVYYAYYPNNFRNVRYTNLNHLKLGLVFKVDEKLAISLNPGIFVALKEEHNGRYGYQQSIIEPVYEHNGTNNRVEIGYAFGLGIHFHP